MRLLSTIVTSLEMPASARAARGDARLPQGFRVEEERRMPLSRYRALYRAVGAAHHWTSRLLPDDRLKEEIHAPRTRIYVATLHRETAGWFEIEVRRTIREARIVHFGLLPAFRGRGLAGAMLEAAIAAGFDEGARRLLLETNSLDHPAALGLYRSHGFVPYASREVQTPSFDSFPLHAEVVE